MKPLNCICGEVPDHNTDNEVSHTLCCLNLECNNQELWEGVEERTEELCIQSWNALVEEEINKEIAKKEKVAIHESEQTDNNDTKDHYER